MTTLPPPGNDDRRDKGNPEGPKLPSSAFSIVIPTDEICDKLRNLCETLPTQDSMVYEFARLLAGRLGNSKIAPMGFKMASELLLHDLQTGNVRPAERASSEIQGQPGVVYAILGMNLNRIAEATCPPEFAGALKDINSFVGSEMKRETEEKRAANPPSPIEIDLKEYLGTVQAIQRYIVDAINEVDPYGKSTPSKDTPNPYYYQVEPNGGIALIMSYGGPSGFGTPLGELRLSNGGGFSPPAALIDAITEKLGAVEIVPKKITHQGEFGPILAITKDLDGNPLPMAALTKRESYIEYNEAKRLWDENLPDGAEDTGAISRRFAADDAILQERGRIEPKPTDEDVRSLDGLRSLGTPYIKYTRDQGETWHYAKINTYEPYRYTTMIGGAVVPVVDPSISINNEVMPNTKCHSTMRLDESNFRDEGFIIRCATEDEVKGLKFSYEREPVEVVKAEASITPDTAPERPVTNTSGLDPIIHFAAALGNPAGFIEASEARGQQELLESDVLPVDMSPSREAFERAGFKFGEPVQDDPIFVKATLPTGWSRKGSDHSMWTYIVDEQGRERVSIFYKAAFYDRSAHMSLRDEPGEKRD